MITTYGLIYIFKLLILFFQSHIMECHFFPLVLVEILELEAFFFFFSGSESVYLFSTAMICVLADET